MQLLRYAVDESYCAIKPLIFAATKSDPEKSHANAVLAAQILYHTGLAKLLLDTPLNREEPTLRLANAAGSNKNGNIPPKVLQYLGFTVNVVGTVTADSYQGNKERPRVWRIPESESLVNFLGLPGVGAEQVKRNLEKYDRSIHTRINVMSTPGKKGNELLDDIAKTFDILYTLADSWELNISCPNTGHGDLEKHRELVGKMIQKVTPYVNASKPLYIKMSPDQTLESIESTMDTCAQTTIVKGFVGTNTTSQRTDAVTKECYPNGGMSGRELYPISRAAQNHIEHLCDTKFASKNWQIIACGGISNRAQADERTKHPRVVELQAYTGFIYQGPKLLTKFREHFKR